MNILVICSWGRNRSKYLAGYLEHKGYSTRYRGANHKTDNQVNEDDIMWSEIIITVHSKVYKMLKERNYRITSPIIELDVDDRYKEYFEGKEFTEEEWFGYQKNYVYPELEKQISKYLPF